MDSLSNSLKDIAFSDHNLQNPKDFPDIIAEIGISKIVM